MFSLAVLFQLITLPVEFNASHRAMQQLERTGILGGNELRDTRKVPDCGSYDLCGKCGIYDTAASAVDHLIWRTTQR